MFGWHSARPLGSEWSVGKTFWVDKGRTRLRPVLCFKLLLQRDQPLPKPDEVRKPLRLLTTIRILDGYNELESVVVVARLKSHLLIFA